MTGGRATWTNWVGNQSFVAELATPRSEEEVVEHVRAAISAGKVSAPRAPATPARPSCSRTRCLTPRGCVASRTSTPRAAT